MASTALSHALFPFFIILMLTIFLIGFTTSTSSLRPAILPVIVYCAYVSITHALDGFEDPSLAAPFGGYASQWALHYVDVALLSR